MILKSIKFLFLISIVQSACTGQNTNQETSGQSAPAEVVKSSDPDLAKSNSFALEDSYRYGATERQSGHVDARGTFKDGKKDGVWVTYHDRLQTFGPNAEVVTTYKDGQKHGVEMKIDAAGRLNEMAFYVNGKKQGPHTKYQHTATVDETNYKNGELHGVKKTYYIDGTLQMEVTYKEGKRDGIERYYDQQGKLMLETKYVNGVKQE